VGPSLLILCSIRAVGESDEATDGREPGTSLANVGNPNHAAFFR